MRTVRTIVRRALAVFFGAAGVAHFAAAQGFVEIMPPWVPWPEAVVLATGAVELVLAGLLLAPAGRHTRVAGYCLALYCLAVLPANVQMILDPSLSLGLPPAVLWLRVALQFPLIALILWSTSAGAGVRSEEDPERPAR